MQVVGVEVDFKGNSLRSLGGSLSGDLRSSLCAFSDAGVVNPASAPANTEVSYTENQITVDVGEAFGYLAVGTDEVTNIVSSLGVANDAGTGGLISRGRIIPDTLSACP